MLEKIACILFKLGHSTACQIKLKIQVFKNRKFFNDSEFPGTGLKAENICGVTNGQKKN